VGGTQRWHQSNSFYVHPCAASRILNSAHLEKGEPRGGAGLSSSGRTQHPPSLLFFSSPSLLFPLPIPFHPPPPPVLLRTSSGDPQGTEGPALSERPCWCPVLTRSCQSTHASSCTGSLARIHPHVIRLGSRKRTSPPGTIGRGRKAKAASPGVGLQQLHWHEPDARAVALVNQFTFFFPRILCQAPSCRNTYRTLT